MSQDEKVYVLIHGQKEAKESPTHSSSDAPFQSSGDSLTVSHIDTAIQLSTFHKVNNVWQQFSLLSL